MSFTMLSESCVSRCWIPINLFQIWKMQNMMINCLCRCSPSFLYRAYI